MIPINTVIHSFLTHLKNPINRPKSSKDHQKKPKPIQQIPSLTSLLKSCRHCACAAHGTWLDLTVVLPSVHGADGLLERRQKWWVWSVQRRRGAESVVLLTTVQRMEGLMLGRVEEQTWSEQCFGEFTIFMAFCGIYFSQFP